MKPLFALINEDTKQYTLLNAKKSVNGPFQGEHSLLFNQYDENLIILSKFIEKFAGNDIRIVTNNEERYLEMIHSYERFLHGEIDQYVGEQIDQKKYEEQNLETEKLLGQTQVLILKKWIEEKIKDLNAKEFTDDSSKDSILSRLYELEWVLQKINFLSQVK